MAQMIAYCGTDCSKCSAYLATQQDDWDALAKVAEQWTKEYKHPFKAEDIVCDGCIAASGRVCSHGHVCPIRTCGQEHQVANCSACDELDSCTKLYPDAREKLQEMRAQ